MLKIYTKDKKWIVLDGDIEKEFDASLDAWRYAFLMRDIRPKVPKVHSSIYPVTTLNPFPSRKRKKIILTVN